MAKKQKRGKAGNAVQYLTRNQAIKKLQLRLSEFRRLCILKGIHPREPKKKVQGANKTYYHVKDINWLAHEPLINTFRSLKVHDRRVRKAAAKQQLGLARRLMATKPGYKLDHLVKERYPSFIDALRDLDDPLTMVHLFATLPSEATKGIKPATVDKCRRLVLEWNAYVARTSALRRCFVSVKGFYYQAEVAGCSVTWLVPHQLSQVLPSDVDFAVMITFLEFYCCLAQFVMFKLYHDLGLRYPPVVDRRAEAAAAGLAGLMRDIAAAGAAGQQHQQQQQLEGGGGGDGEAAGDGGAAGGAAGAAPLPEVVQRLGSLGRKIRELQAQEQQQHGGGGDASAAAAAAAGGGAEADEASEDDGSDDASLPDIDSGGSDESGDDSSGGEDESEEEEEDEEEAAAAPGGGGSEEQQQDEGEGAAEGAVAGAAVAGGGLSEVDPDDDGGLCAVLLKGLTFFLAREVPREPLLFIIRSFGGVVGWDGEGSPVQEADESIAYQIVDRPTQGHKYLSRSYVQPQWLFDSVNHRVLMPAELYAPGRVPPPHLSPFVDNEAEGYTPEFAHTIRQLQDAARAARRAAAGKVHDAVFLEGGGDAAAAGADAAAAGEEEGGAAAGVDEAAAEKAYRQDLARELRAAGKQQQQQQQHGGDAGAGSGSENDEGGSDAGSQEEDEEEEGGEGQQQGAAGRKRPAAAAAAPGGAEDEDEEGAMADIMMSRKTRKLYGRINRAIAGKAERVAALEGRKRALEQQQGQEGQQQTPTKQQQQRVASSKKQQHSKAPAKQHAPPRKQPKRGAK